MSWLFSRALAEAYLGASSSDGGQSVPSSRTPTPQAYLWRDKTTDAWNRFPSGMTCEPLTADRGTELLKSFQADFHAKTCPSPKPTPAAVSLWKMDWLENAPVCGPKWHELLAKYDPSSFSWKTSSDLLPTDFSESLAIFPKWGTTQGGAAFPLEPLVPRIPGSDCFLLLTPIASDGKKRYSFRANSLAGRFRKHPNGNLAEQVAFLALERGLTDGRLNPAFWEWMIGWPTGWARLQPVATDKFQ